ncbi:O-antigen acetylase [Burkholderia pseudomallei]|uniref:acyltransferase family protein n=1 Tax=Burkholderia pseudomallei TaxID=28450 RepID=UPI000F066634|nr:acyltransferase [Burkholderia pseudomallei]CAJ4074458.1 O-antigen acetylase [Burkholderia pseudomallei]CAJ4131682.1 O-antigen acetylase [Burkholderia pseudomallei]CAJ5422545.1 O-antigen acetylase [Burkholderia pseudomallei]CAJ6066678.1 O-antigen acetylase [Burkholderia pseudomallei]CAJ6120637.1 O-antigen acetylase [Burkholderia pseudomallei]
MKSEIPVTVPDRFDAADVLGAPQSARVADPSTLANPADRLSTHDNGFGLLRLLFATMVLWDHAFPLGGFGADPMWRLTLNQDSMGGICVSGFFAISGFLIAKSGMRADALQFAWRRCVRIFPAYWAVLIVTALCVGPIIHYVQAGTLHGYWNAALGGPLGYITNNWRLTIGQYGINDLLRDTTPYGHSISESVFNGSIWTLIYEAKCYVMVGLFAMFGLLTAHRRALLAVTVVAWFVLAIQTINPAFSAQLLPWAGDRHLVQYGTIFLIGSSAAAYSKSLPISDKLGAFAVVVYLISLFKGGYLLLGYPAMVYAILWLACRLPRWARRIGSRNDYSYGIYVFGFLVQQVLAYVGAYKYGFVFYLAASVFFTFICAWFSWHLIEKRALALKDWGPGQGWKYCLARLTMKKEGV